MTFKEQMKDCVANTNNSSFICFVKLIKNKKFEEKKIRRLFRYINKDDISGSNKKQIIRWLIKKSNV